MIRLFITILFSVTICGCGPDSPEIIRVKARPVKPMITMETGEHSLNLGGMRLVNRSIIWKDGILYIPRIAKSGQSMPLLVWLHGGGGRADSFRYIFPLAEKLGTVVLLIDARHNTWDGIDSAFGPDVQFIDTALQYTFNRVAIDPKKIGIGGISDGASYALALGRSNGDFFTHLIAVAPGLLDPPGPPIGMPRIFVAHGTRDNVYSVIGSRRYIVPRLKAIGYDVTYLEFDGPHWLPAPVAYQILEWLSQKN